MTMRPRYRGLRPHTLAVLALVLAGAPPAVTTVQAQAATPSAHPERRYLGADLAPLPFTDSHGVLEFLRTASVIDRERLGGGSTQPLRVTLEQGTVRARAIFRDIAIQRDRVKLRDGSDFVQFFDRAIHEVAAFEVARALGIGAMIPPVVERRMSGNPGTLQLWVEDTITEAERARRQLRPPDTAAWLHQQADMRVFDALIANSDRNTGNSLIDGDWNLWMIDHTRGFQRPRGSLRMDHLTRVSAHLLEALRTLDGKQLRARLTRYLEGPQIASLLARQQDLVAHFDALIEARGAGAVVIR